MHGVHTYECCCDNVDCDIARYIRNACAEKVRAAIQLEYGSTPQSDFHLGSFPPYEWVCRAFPMRSERACPSCNYVPRPALSWAVHGARFALKGVLYSIVSVGSTNRYSPNHMHFEEYVIGEKISDDPWSLPETPCPVSDVAASLDVLFNKMPKFRMHELDNAMREV